MKPYQERVVAEKAEIEETVNQTKTRLGALKPFLGRPAFQDLPKDEQARMLAQANMMKTFIAAGEAYVEVLAARIEAFESD